MKIKFIQKSITEPKRKIKANFLGNVPTLNLIK